MDFSASLTEDDILSYALTSLSDLLLQNTELFLYKVLRY